jgi:hypothetical protein
MFASMTSDALYLLMTISHTSIPTPIRVYNANEFENGEPKILTSRGNQFVAFPFDITLPEEGGDTPPQITLSICNIDRGITDSIRSIATRMTITLEIVLSESLDTVEAGPFTMSLTDVQYDAFTISGTLIYDSILSEVFPKDKMDATIFPGLF